MSRQKHEAPGAGTGVAIVVEGRILLIRRRREPEAGAWGLPGGKVDLFETAEAAAERETLEETGLTVEVRELLCIVNQIDRAAGVHWLAPVFLATRFSGTPRILEPHKHDGLEWFALDRLPQPLTTPTRTAVAALARRGRA